MSFTDKLKFWKKDDDLSSDDNFDMDKDPFANEGGLGSNQSNDPFSSNSNSLDDNNYNPENPLGNQMDTSDANSADPFADSSAQGSTPMPSQQMPNEDNMAPTRDELMGESSNPFPESSHKDLPPGGAQSFDSNEEQPKNQEPTLGHKLAHDYINGKKEDSSNKPHDPLEMINLKLDAIRGSLENIDLRLRKIEAHVEKKRSW